MKIFFFTILTGLILFTGCKDREIIPASNRYYFELVNTKDTLTQFINAHLDEAYSYFEAKKLMILPKMYVNTLQPDMHYYANIANKKDPVRENDQKIRMEMFCGRSKDTGNYPVDSTWYSIQQYRYESNKWVKFSDIGSFQANTQNTGVFKSDYFYTLELGNMVTTSMVRATYR